MQKNVGRGLCSRRAHTPNAAGAEPLPYLYNMDMIMYILCAYNVFTLYIL
jgi:hypothetical protein